MLIVEGLILQSIYSHSHYVVVDLRVYTSESLSSASKIHLPFRSKASFGARS